MRVPPIHTGNGTDHRFRWYGAAALAVLLVVPAVASARGGAAPAEDKANDVMVVTWRAPSPTSSRGAVPEVVSAPGQANLEFVALSQPCRFYDTRVAGLTPFAANESRDITVLDTGLPVGLGPCGVPQRAKAVDLSLSTLGGSPTGTGFTRIGPGGVASIATVLQFAKGQGVSATTTASLSADWKVRITSYNAGAGYVADLLGFWQEPLQGVINAAGELASGSGVTLIQKSPTFLGDYLVTFDRTIYAGCAAVAIGDSAASRFLATAVSPTQWFFDARAYNATTEIDSGFAFVVQC